MYVVVTGGSGLLGSAVIKQSLAMGCRVLNLDLIEPTHSETAFQQVDMCDFNQVYTALTGADVVIHCAGIPRPGNLRPDRIFNNNVQSTFNVFEAARLHQIGRVVYVSSIAVLGFPFFERPFVPTYLPVDEHSPRLAQDPYGLSKLIGEDITQAYVQRGALTAVSLRFPWIHTPESFRERLLPLQQVDPDGEGPANLWAYIDARDAARACWLAASRPIEGHQVLFAAASDTFMPGPTLEVVRSHYPTVPIKGELTGRSGLISGDRVRVVLGFEPQYHWEQYL